MRFVTAALALLWLAPALTAAGLRIDFARTNGTLRLLHGVNLGPLCYRGIVDLSAYHRELQLPLTRLHDVVWVNYDAVDISTIFREFRNDAADPASYEFAATDDYLASVVGAGSPILYRLGESIEHTPRKYRVHPPKDIAKWAEVCCAIIRHYNEGWAGGFRHHIRYWEIWNEPENQPAMWTGSDEEYFQLYEVTAKAIKTRWPDLKVGGPSLGYTGDFEGDRFKPGSFLLRFLQHCREHQVPLDFFSWHRYAKEPSEMARRARALRAVLDEQGFRGTESHLNEWNFLPDEDWRPMMKEGQGAVRDRWSAEMGGPKAAAFAAWTLVSLQDAPVDMANFYTAEVQMFGMFNLNGVPRKTYHAFRAFRLLRDTPVRVSTPPCAAGQIAVGAGLNPAGTAAAVLLSQFENAGTRPDLELAGLPWRGATSFQLRILDADHDLEVVREGRLAADPHFAVPELVGPAVALLTLSPAPSDRP